MSESPSGWVTASLLEAAVLITDGDHNPPKRVPEGVPHLTARNVRGGRLVLDRCTFISHEDFTRMRRRYTPLPGDVIVTCVGTLGQTAIVPEGISFSADRNLAAIRPSEAMLSSFLKAALDAPEPQSVMQSGSGSTAQPHLYLGDLRELKIPVPPLAEQKRIVAAIDEQFSRLDAGVAALERVRLNLKRMRDLLPLLLLAGAGVGQGIAGDSPVDDGPCRWVPLAEVSQHVVDCEHWTPKYLSEGMPCIDTTCISAGFIHRERLRYVDPATHQNRIRRLAPQRGDLIFAREGTVGTTVVVPKDLHPCLGQRVMLFRPNPETVNSEYMCLVVNSLIVKRQYRPMLLGTTVPHLNVRDAKALRIPLPALPVQRAIVAEADRIGSVLSAVEVVVELNVARSSSLRSSILAAAFSGKLVPQDPGDEAASTLLERIAARRASSTASNPHGAAASEYHGRRSSYERQRHHRPEALELLQRPT